MEGYINKNQWVDLSGLPRKGTCIDWVKSIGLKVPFQYKNVNGYINIVGRSNSNEAIMITIDKYVPQPRKIFLANLRNCELQKLVYNKIADARPDLVQYLDNPNEAYLYSVGSSHKMCVHCPVCGYQTKISTQKLSTQGMHCPICGKGFSYPSKLMANILISLNIPFIREASKLNVEFQWAQNYRYDFYIQRNSRKIIIEMDGWFHQFGKDVDAIKDRLAVENGFEIIRIDSNYTCISSRFSHIKNNIINSELSRLLPLEKVDWNKCHRMSLLESPVQIACSLWEFEHKNVKEISEVCHVGRESVMKYLKIGNEIGLCPSYSPQESEVRSHCKCVAIYDSNENISYVFRSMTEVSKMSKDVLGVFISIPMVGCACNGTSKAAKGFKMSCISYDEYMYYSNILNEQYKMNEKNKVTLEEVS